MEELHEHGKATIDHTTLLLNCYAKLKDTEKLETFIKSGSNFDFDTAIAMCRQGGYYNQAVFLAKKHGEHDLVVDILIEDSKSYDEALTYIWKLEPDLAYPNLMKYARVLLEHCSKDATQIFIEYYTGSYQPKKEMPAQPAPAVPSGTGNALTNLTSYIPLPYRSSLGVTSPAATETQSLNFGGAEADEAGAAQSIPEYSIPKPRTVFSAFVDHPSEFITFLESCLKQEHVDEGDKIDLYTTLFEMYLETASHLSGSDRQDWEAKAKGLIDSQQVFVPLHIHAPTLIACRFL